MVVILIILSMNNDKSFVKAILIGLCVIALIYILFFLTIYNCLFLSDTEKAGEFGDMFGSVNSLFSALAFLVIAISLYLQNHELKLQRQDSIDTGFESKFMFFLQNLERRVNDTRGKFYDEQSLDYLPLEGSKYFDAIFKETNDINKIIISSQGPIGSNFSQEQGVLLDYYNIKGDVFWDKYKMEVAQDFSKTLINSFHDKRRTEYFNAWITFRHTIKMLRKEYDKQLEDTSKPKEEIDSNFSVYVDMLKSALPFTARIYFLYANLLGYKTLNKHFIASKLYEDVMSADYLHQLHRDILYND